MRTARQKFKRGLRNPLRRQRRREACPFLGGGYDFHCIPVIGKLFAAFEADHVRTCDAGLPATGTRAKGHRKTVAKVPTSENRVEQFSQHMPSQHASASSKTAPRLKIERRSLTPLGGARKRSGGEERHCAVSPPVSELQQGRPHKWN